MNKDESVKFILKFKFTVSSITTVREYKNVHVQLNTEFATDDNTERFKLHTTDTHKRKRIIIRRECYKKEFEY